MHKMHNFTSRIEKIEALAARQDDVAYLQALRALTTEELLTLIRSHLVQLRDSGLFPETFAPKKDEVL